MRVFLVSLVCGVFLVNATAVADSPMGALPDNKRMQAVINAYHQIFYGLPQTWQMNEWMGIETQQNPNDAWITQEIISERKPDYIVETGTMMGGSALLWAMVQEQVNPEGRVITIDIKDRTAEAQKVPAWKKVDFILGSSADPEVIDRIRERVQGSEVLVILDSAHDKDHVLAELEAYWKMVPVGGYLIVQDTNLNGHPVAPTYGPGPWEALEEFLSTNGHFVIDRDRERLLFTMHPNGYLKRVR